MSDADGTANEQKQRCSVRRAYHSLFLTEQDDKVELEDCQSDRLQNYVGRSDELLEEVRFPKEQALDSQLFSCLTRHGVQKVRALTHSNQWTFKDFLIQTGSQFGKIYKEGDSIVVKKLDFASIGRVCACLFTEAPSLPLQLSLEDIVSSTIVKQRNNKRARRKSEQGTGVKVARVVELEEEEGTDKQETDKLMEQMYKIVRQKHEVPILSIIMNTLSFPQTVENIFTLSFLIRDFKVVLKRGTKENQSDRQCFVALRRHVGKQEQGGEGSLQLILKMEFGDWEFMRKLIKQEECLMPHRFHND